MDTNLIIAIASFPVVFILAALRVPVGLALLVCGIGGLALTMQSPFDVLLRLKTETVSMLGSYTLLIIPLFYLMGQFASGAGIVAGVYQVAVTYLGRYRGGVALSTLLTCASFGAVSGSSLATAATVGKMALPEMRAFGYSDRLTGGCLAAGGTLGILIPPSLVLVIYALLAEQNVAKLFLAALVPALLAIAGYAIAITVIVRKHPKAKTHGTLPATAILQAVPMLVTLGLVIGGLIAGWFTPAEAAAVGCLLTLGFAIRKKAWKQFPSYALETAKTTGMIFFILFGASVFNTFLGYCRLPNAFADAIANAHLSAWVILCLILLAFIALGAIMESLSMIILTVPLVLPALMLLDFGLPAEEFAIWFGILVLVIVEIGLLTPPIGLNLFVIASLDPHMTIRSVARGVRPFLLAELIRISLLVAFPGLSLVLVRALL